MAEQPDFLQKYALTITKPQPGARSRAFKVRNVLVLLDLFGVDVIAQQEQIVKKIKDVLDETKTDDTKKGEEQRGGEQTDKCLVGAITKSNEAVYSARRPGVNQGGSIILATVQQQEIWLRGYGDCSVWLVKNGAVALLDGKHTPGYLGSYQVSPQNFFRLKVSLNPSDWLILTTGRLSKEALERIPKKDARQFIKAFERAHRQEAASVLQLPPEPVATQARGIGAGAIDSVTKRNVESLGLFLITVSLLALLFFTLKLIYPSPIGNGGTSKPTNTVTPSKTPIPSATPEAAAASISPVAPVAPATNTPTAVPTLVETVTQAPPPTPTPVPPTPVPSTTIATPTPETTSSGLPIEQLNKLAVRLISPDNNGQGNGEILFRWEPNSGLPTGYAYELVFLKDADPENLLKQGLGWKGSSREPEAKIPFDNLTIDGQLVPEGIYYWAVSLVQEPPEYKRIHLLSDVRQYTFTRRGNESNADTPPTNTPTKENTPPATDPPPPEENTSIPP